MWHPGLSVSVQFLPGASLLAQLVKKPPAKEEDTRKLPWRRKWQPTLVFLPRNFRRQESLAGYSSQKVTKSLTWQSAHTHTHTVFPCAAFIVLIFCWFHKDGQICFLWRRKCIYLKIVERVKWDIKNFKKGKRSFMWSNKRLTKIRDDLIHGKCSAHWVQEKLVMNVKWFNETKGLSFPFQFRSGLRKCTGILSSCCCQWFSQLFSW